LIDQYSLDIKVRMSGLCINQYRPMLDVDYRPANNPPSVHLYPKLCLGSSIGLTFVTFFTINAFINVYYYFWEFEHIYVLVSHTQ